MHFGLERRGIAVGNQDRREVQMAIVGFFSGYITHPR